MKRFVDLRQTDVSWNFAWFDTVVDKFESFSNEMVFDTWKGFEECYDGTELDRYLGLCPDWVSTIGA